MKEFGWSQNKINVAPERLGVQGLIAIVRNRDHSLSILDFDGVDYWIAVRFYLAVVYCGRR